MTRDELLRRLRTWAGQHDSVLERLRGVCTPEELQHFDGLLSAAVDKALAEFGPSPAAVRAELWREALAAAGWPLPGREVRR